MRPAASFIVLIVPIVAWGQSSRPAPDGSEGRRLLGQVQDNVFSFDDEAFYWLCRRVATQPVATGAEPAEPVPWRFLLERPSDYRGESVMIEGNLQSRVAFDVANRLPDLRLHECELSDRDTHAICTVITTDDPSDVPLRSRVRAQGYFLKARLFRTAGGDTGAGPLVVAKRLEVVSTPRTGLAFGSEGDMTVISWLAGATAMMAILWWAVRRRAKPATHARRGPNAGVGSPAESDRDFDWMQTDPEHPDSHQEGRDAAPNADREAF